LSQSTRSHAYNNVRRAFRHSVQVQKVAWETLIGRPATPKTPAVLVTGATGGVGSRVVARLLAKGRRVRALVRDVAKARTQLAGLHAAPGAVLEVIAADVTQPATLRPELFAHVRSVVSCMGCIARPKDAKDEDDANEKCAHRRRCGGRSLKHHNPFQFYRTPCFKAASITQVGEEKD
jgi:hypothetical protein